MKKAIVALTLLLAVVALAVVFVPKPGVERSQPAVYYWRTTFALDSVERDFLARHGVTTIYMRYFDVVVTREGRVKPNATIKFRDSVPAGVKVVPTVFIVENCLRHNLDSVAPLLVSRVRQISETHGVPVADELQIDCDWTATSRADYYRFLAIVRRQLAEHGMKLSVTVRLHQLAMPSPPADYGVLMVYNTGDITKKDGGDPILNPDDVKPYLKYVDAYDLPLCAAYPCFGWDLLYRGDDFQDILYDARFDDASLFAAAGDGKWVVVQDRDLPQFASTDAEVLFLHAGDSVIHRQPAADDILAVRRTLERHRATINNRVILYSLDSKSLNNYNSSYYEKVFNR